LDILDVFQGRKNVLEKLFSPLGWELRFWAQLKKKVGAKQKKVGFVHSTPRQTNINEAR
jgi:hypothetical protein